MGQISWNKGLTKETDERIQDAWNKGLTKETDERVRGQSEKLKGRKRASCSDGAKRKIGEANSKNMKRLWQDPEYRKKMLLARKGCKRPPHSEASKKKIGSANVENMKRLWQDPEYIKMQMRAHNICPNKAEKRLDLVLQDLFPNEYKFVGDGQFILARKCPDFVNINGQKKIIELFGEHVHTEEEAQDRCSLFAEYGYQTLIIWFNEIWDVSTLVSKLVAFNERQINDC
jgi:very-short-patch-repair endonuclease